MWLFCAASFHCAAAFEQSGDRFQDIRALPLGCQFSQLRRSGEWDAGILYSPFPETATDGLPSWAEFARVHFEKIRGQ